MEDVYLFVYALHRLFVTQKVPLLPLSLELRTDNSISNDLIVYFCVNHGEIFIPSIRRQCFVSSFLERLKAFQLRRKYFDNRINVAPEVLSIYFFVSTAI